MWGWGARESGQVRREEGAWQGPGKPRGLRPSDPCCPCGEALTSLLLLQCLQHACAICYSHGVFLAHQSLQLTSNERKRQSEGYKWSYWQTQWSTAWPVFLDQWLRAASTSEKDYMYWIWRSSVFNLVGNLLWSPNPPIKSWACV